MNPTTATASAILRHYVTTIRMRSEVYGDRIDMDALRSRLFKATRKHPAIFPVLEKFVTMRDEGERPKDILIAIEKELAS